MIELVIFDCDGVLIDSEVLSFAVDTQVLAGHGIEMTADVLARRYGGVSYGEMIAQLNDQHTTAIDAVAYQAECEGVLEGLFETDLRAISGISDVLKSLAVPCCVASASDLARLDKCLGVTGLLEFFGPRIFSVEEVKHGKPAPDIFLHAANECGFTPERSIVIEDSPAGIVAAQAAGMRAVGFLGGGHRSPEDADILMDAGAEDVVGNGAELHRYLANIGLVMAA
ncbi:HAD-IA family hydrolase [Thalassospira alkalitolerans]|uniref:HAD family hydrolase n=1 Tax=Thalassospira alkalitolerans TaxID=1293890 RepID=UPI0030EBBC16|tara:strand:- start:137356 stop:138033 length:678 start_codon:yes stop_codon:yes gene_type:complete